MKPPSRFASLSKVGYCTSGLMRPSKIAYRQN